ncbi:hypothetical protein [Rock bream iridovirus]|uniref:ORF019L n=2 Tax=Infectious spleen and kidney necrosis virus TaxID=180170 RepID=Q5YF68_ISKNV|nr:ORF019L [Rock bream iridovirus]AAX82330.1 ORF21L [Orange-spotted grouper iridovirus]AGG37899.1 hypothetical protein [Rock bream iridovirus]
MITSHSLDKIQIFLYIKCHSPLSSSALPAQVPCVVTRQVPGNASLPPNAGLLPNAGHP